MKYKIYTMWILLASISSTYGQAAIGKAFTFQKVSEHVYAAVPVKSTRLNATSSIIVGKHFIVVVETQSDEHTSDLLLHQIRAEISRLPVKYLLLTHYHVDHVWGSNAFTKESPSVIIGGSKEIYEQLVQKGKDKQKELSDFISTRSSELKNKAAITSDPDQKKEYLQLSLGLSGYNKDINESKLVLPQLLVSDTLVIRDDSLQINYFCVGKAHSPGDMIVYVPTDKILITGDIVHDFQPLVWEDSNPEAWINVLNSFSDLPIKTIVGGHGNPVSIGVIQLWKSYLSEIISLVQNAIKRGISLAQLQKETSFSSLKSLTANNYGKKVSVAVSNNMNFGDTGVNWESEINTILAAIWSFEKQK